MVYNFSAGPAMLPVEVMQQAQAEFVDFKGSGRGLMELSHRGALFTQVIDETVADIRELMNIPDSHAVCFIQGGATMQFAMVPFNLMGQGGASADYADTGVWSAKAAKEARLFGGVNIVCSSKETKYDHIPELASWKCDPAAAYLHITSNNTVAGTQYHRFPTPPANVPMVADMSSDIMSKVIDVNQFGLIYAGAQKNLGPSGMALVIVRKDLAGRTPANVPTLLRYDTYINENSLYNTPPTFGIYMLGLVAKWIKAKGGIAAIEKLNDAKAARLYDFLDSSSFYSTPVAKDSRSKMNVVFRTPNEELDAVFVKESGKANLTDLKGHRLVGGLRASIYNAMPMAGIEALIDFMKEFERRNG